MAKISRTIYGDFYELRSRIENGILNGSISATLEDKSDYQTPEARCSVLVFERYSHIGKNRVSMNVTLFQAGKGPVQLCAITSGGSGAVFWKVNTWGEESFLKTLEKLL